MKKYIKSNDDFFNITTEETALFGILSGIDKINNNYSTLANAGFINEDVNELYNQVHDLLQKLDKSVRNQIRNM